MSVLMDKTDLAATLESARQSDCVWHRHIVVRGGERRMRTGMEECWDGIRLLLYSDRFDHSSTNILDGLKSYSFWAHFYAGVQTNRKERPQ